MSLHPPSVHGHAIYSGVQMIQPHGDDRADGEQTLLVD